MEDYFIKNYRDESTGIMWSMAEIQEYIQKKNQ